MGHIIIIIIINIIIIIVHMTIKQKAKYFWYYGQLDYFYLDLFLIYKQKDLIYIESPKYSIANHIHNCQDVSFISFILLIFLVY